ncbi:MAG TPA: four helix bundle protein [Tepidisphaeraceae bacterium]|nr:four helix bundle protein [Tepidisphaeraceae bacterium]
MRNYKELIAWQRAMDLVEAVYRVTRGFPRDEIYALTNQLRRAAVSIPSNIAEGQGRGGTAEFIHFLNVSYGSLQELETQLLIAERLGYVEAAALAAPQDLAAEVCRLVSGLLRSLQSSLSTDHCPLWHRPASSPASASRSATPRRTSASSC